eukprot:jgi/Psemu1/16540/gm1.16540_g
MTTTAASRGVSVSRDQKHQHQHHHPAPVQAASAFQYRRQRQHQRHRQHQRQHQRQRQHQHPTESSSTGGPNPPDTGGNGSGSGCGSGNGSGKRCAPNAKPPTSVVGTSAKPNIKSSASKTTSATHTHHRWPVGETVEMVPRNHYHHQQQQQQQQQHNGNGGLPDFGIIVGLNDDGTYNLMNILNGCWRRFVRPDQILGNGCDDTDYTDNTNDNDKDDGNNDGNNDGKEEEDDDDVELGLTTNWCLERFEDEL